MRRSRAHLPSPRRLAAIAVVGVAVWLPGCGAINDSIARGLGNAVMVPAGGAQVRVDEPSGPHRATVTGAREPHAGSRASGERVAAQDR